MSKQILLAAAGFLLVFLLFEFGRTVAEKKPLPTSLSNASEEQAFNIQQFIDSEKRKLPPATALALAKMENSVTRGDVVKQQVQANEALAEFWKDSLKRYEPYAFYIAAAAKLDNSEKNLTFAARLFSENLRGENDDAKLKWETGEAIDLYNRALKLDPDNDDLHIGLGSCYIYGNGKTGDPQETMQGIKELLTVVRKDSTNMKAQMLLGVGGIVSGQFDKAVERLKKVVDAEPKNAEAVAYLADAYAGKGEKEEAIRWYTMSKRLINNEDYSKRADERIKMLK